MTIKQLQVEKLIRDKIPAFLESKGISIHTKTLDDQEYISKLKDKLLEETKEVLRTRNRGELCEELADVMEVIHALSKANNLTIDEIDQQRLKKRQIKGGFDNKIYNSSVEIEEHNPAISNYSKSNSVNKSNCLFCQISRQEKETAFYATFTYCYVIKDQFPVSNRHILIIPHEHTENWFTAKEEVRLDMMQALHLMKRQLDLEYTPHGYNIGANCGEVAGQSVMHLHLHLIPRYKGDMEDPKGGVRGVIPSNQKY